MIFCRISDTSVVVGNGSVHLRINGPALGRVIFALAFTSAVTQGQAGSARWLS